MMLPDNSNKEELITVLLTVSQLRRLKEILERNVAPATRIASHATQTDIQLMTLINLPLQRIDVNESRAEHLRQLVKEANRTHLQNDLIWDEMLIYKRLDHYGMTEVLRGWTLEQVRTLALGINREWHPLAKNYKYLYTYERIIVLGAMDSPFHLIGIYPNGQMVITI